MSLINILVAVDSDALAQQIRDGSINSGSFDKPTSLSSYSASDVYIAMIAQNNVAVNEQGKSELTIKAQSGDTIRWNMTTFGSNTDNTASLYAGKFSPSGAISPLTSLTPAINNYFPSDTDPETAPLVHFVNHYHVVQGTIMEVNVKIQYTLEFVLVDNSNGKILGYFTWDPFIEVA